MATNFVELKLRPHHVLGFIAHEIQPDFYYLPDEKYIKYFREEKRRDAEEAVRQQRCSEEDIRKAEEFAYNFHSDGLILHWRNTIKQLHENPDLKFRYVPGLDSVCEKCPQKEGCHDKNHWAYKVVQQADGDAIKQLLELEFGEMYDGRSLRRFITRIQKTLEQPSDFIAKLQKKPEN